MTCPVCHGFEEDTMNNVALITGRHLEDLINGKKVVAKELNLVVCLNCGVLRKAN